MELLDEFKKCLLIMSYCRAGWDFQLSRRLRAEEDMQEYDALSRARTIWAENPGLHADLRAAFAEERPLASMEEIERATA